MLHHSLTGRAGVARTTGFDRASFGRNSKVIHSWTRAQINIGPGEADNNDSLILACGKCSNGREFDRFAVRLNPATMLYEPDPDFDLSGWEVEMGAKAKQPALTLDMVADLCEGAMRKKDLAKAIMDESGCCKQYAYRMILQAEKGRKIHYTKALGTYVRK